MTDEEKEAIGDKNTKTTAREKNYKLVRNIDNIKRQIEKDIYR